MKILFAATGVLLSLFAGAPRSSHFAPAEGGPPRRPLRLAIFPTESLASSPVPMRALEAQVERSLAGAGVDVVSGQAVETFLERYRIRYTGGVQEDVALAAARDLQVDGILVTALEAVDTGNVPRLALVQRVVGAAEDAPILWMDGVARTGNDAPGFLGLGIVRDYGELQARELDRLAASLSAAASGSGKRFQPCPDDGRYSPRFAYRYGEFRWPTPLKVAVLPFMNETTRRRAGDIAALELVRQLAAVEGVRVVEPGVVRGQLIQRRVIMEGGISVETARTVVDGLGADLVVAGYVREFVEGDDPRANVTIVALEGATGRVVWETSSHGNGMKGVWLFDAGRVFTASGLICRMMRESTSYFSRRNSAETR